MARSIISKLCFLLILFFSTCPCLAVTQNEPTHPPVRVWADNFNHPATIDFIKLALQKSSLPHLASNLTPAKASGVLQAVEQVKEGKQIDMLVSGANAEWEALLLPIYFPLERGLLGFRVCLINAQQQRLFEPVRDSSGFIDTEVRIGLLNAWPDSQIMHENQVPLIEFDELESLIEGLQGNAFECFSRSVIEVHEDLVSYPQVEVEALVGLIYPFADFMYVAPARPQLRDALKEGIIAAWNDGSFQTLYQKHYASRLAEYRFYTRKLLIMDNPALSKPALQAINQFGVASFAQGGPAQ